jgi:hypothetical protein
MNKKTTSYWTRRRFLKEMAGTAAAGTLLSACGQLVPAQSVATPSASPAKRTNAPASPTGWTPPEPRTGDHPSGEGSLRLGRDLELTFDASAVETQRPDIFQEEHFSIYDVVAHLGERGDLELESHFDETLDTHVIDTINGKSGWWYQAHYSNGWFEVNAFRMDMYPYKNNMTIWLQPGKQGRVEAIHNTFRDEVTRREQNGGEVILPSLIIRSPEGTWTFEDVPMTAHNLRDDVLQPGVVTALDALIGLTERGELPSLGLTWYETIGGADPVDSYWIEEIGPAQAAGGCGFVYEIGPREFSGFSGSHIHIPSDVRVVVSPEYALWFWICL